jgi:mono/diheme cytochrome c family protein/uncharacterized membrane protein
MSLRVFLPTRPSARAKGIVLSLGLWLVPWLAGGPWESLTVPAHGAKPSPYHSPGEGSKDAGIDRAILVFRAHCLECHDPDGRGESSREMMRRVPDFTDAKWQDTRSDLDLARSISEGKRTMPAMKSKLRTGELETIVRLVRNFRDGRFQVPEDEDETANSSPTDPAVTSVVRLTRNQPSQPVELATPRPVVDPIGSARALFQRLCVSCHGADGTGRTARDHMPETPDFTDASWQARRGNAQLMASILDGKGSEMPRGRGKISEEQARGMVAYIRSLAPSLGESGQGEQEGLSLAESAEAGPRTSFFEKFIRWLGKFHSPLVHFPIALLTAAAVAELLRLATGKSEFDSISRFCIWFGTLAAVVAGILGWFLAGLRFTDASWVMMTHRWIGTFAVAWAGLVLVLSEMSRHPARHRTQVWFRVTLFAAAGLVSVTGFFGGAVVFGINHYAWPK